MQPARAELHKCPAPHLIAMPDEPASLLVRVGSDGHWALMKRHRRERGSGTADALLIAMTRCGATTGRSRLDNGRIDLVCLPWARANHYTLRVPGEACVIRPDVATLAEAAAAQNNQERRYEELSLHCLYPLTAAPLLHG